METIVHYLVVPHDDDRSDCAGHRHIHGDDNQAGQEVRETSHKKGQTGPIDYPVFITMIHNIFLYHFIDVKIYRSSCYERGICYFTN